MTGERNQLIGGYRCVNTTKVAGPRPLIILMRLEVAMHYIFMLGERILNLQELL